MGLDKNEEVETQECKVVEFSKLDSAEPDTLQDADSAYYQRVFGITEFTREQRSDFLFAIASFFGETSILITSDSLCRWAIKEKLYPNAILNVRIFCEVMDFVVKNIQNAGEDFDFEKAESYSTIGLVRSILICRKLKESTDYRNVRQEIKNSLRTIPQIYSRLPFSGRIDLNTIYWFHEIIDDVALYFDDAP